MKKLTIIFGGSINFYEDRMRLFKNVKKKIGWNFKKLNKERLIGYIGY